LSWIPSKREELGLTLAQHKLLCYLVMLGTQSDGFASYVKVPTDGVLPISRMAKACSLSRGHASECFNHLVETGLVEKTEKSGTRSGYAMCMPEVRGAHYVKVDERKALKMFCYGVPRGAWEVVSMALGDVLTLDASDKYGHLGRMAEVNRNQAEVAFEYDRQNGFIDVTPTAVNGVAKVMVRATV